MKRVGLRLPILALLAVALPGAGLAEDRPAAADTGAERQGEAMDHSQMDHSQMDHSQMDHSQMDHSGHGGHAGHEMSFDAAGMVMNTNRDRLPPGCPAVSRDYDFEVRAGTAYAKAFPGDVFGMSQHEFRVAPCSRVTFTFINEDAIRHQFMIHNLPRNLYPQGMFHLEAAGGATKTGTLIVPGGDKTYLVHCDIAQHMEQGMKGQLVAGSGSGDLSSIPGVSARFREDLYRDPRQWLWVAGGAFLLTLLGICWWTRRRSS
jgi:uncharacterized cupredoxin-like copper-binding protein